MHKKAVKTHDAYRQPNQGQPCDANFAILKKNLTILERFGRFGDEFYKKRALKTLRRF